MTVDAAGNLLLPFNWQGVLATNAGVPVPRLLRGTVRSPLGIAVPDPVFLASYTPEGAKLPPIFEPTADPERGRPRRLTLFGSADAPYTILRIAQPRRDVLERAGQARACSTTIARGGTCPTTCVGGGTPGRRSAATTAVQRRALRGALRRLRPLGDERRTDRLSRVPSGGGICQLEPARRPAPRPSIAPASAMPA